MAAVIPAHPDRGDDATADDPAALGQGEGPARPAALPTPAHPRELEHADLAVAEAGGEVDPERLAVVGEIGRPP